MIIKSQQQEKSIDSFSHKKYFIVIFCLQLPFSWFSLSQYTESLEMADLQFEMDISFYKLYYCHVISLLIFKSMVLKSIKENCLGVL